MKPDEPRTVDGYLARVSGEKRAALEKLRRDIRAAAPEAQECIAYGIPTFRVDGKMLVSFGAAAGHCAFYPGAWPIEALRNDLRAYETRKGTIRFQPGRPLPAALVRKLVRARIAVPASRSRLATKTSPRRRAAGEAARNAKTSRSR